MGRFDVLKGSDSNFKQNENTIKRRRRGGKNKNKEKINQNIVLKDNLVKDVVKDVEKDVEKDVVEKESEWLQQIKKKKEEIMDDININDPRYWNGPNWKGPIFLKQQKPKKNLTKKKLLMLKKKLLLQNIFLLKKNLL